MKQLVDSICIALIGVPGAGKTHLKKRVLDNYPEFKTLIPVTTRNPRENEVNGIDKFFISEVEFMRKLSAGDLFLEIDAYNQKSGFSKENICDHQYYISEFYYKDVKTLVTVFKYCIFILIMPQDADLLIEFLYHRNEDHKEADARINNIKEEIVHLEKMKKENFFDYIFINSYDKNSEDRFMEIIDNVYSKYTLQ